MIAASIAFVTRNASGALLDSTARAAAVVAVLCTIAASPAHSQMLGLRVAAETQSPKNPVISAVEEASQRFHIPAPWVRAVMRAESHGDANSVSEKGAIGLMQVMPKTYAELQTKLGLGTDPFDPHDNIMAGAAYLADMFERYGEMGFLAAYNAGPRRYEEYLHGRPLPDETTDYVARLVSELGLTGVSPPQIHDRSDAPGAPIFFTASALKMASETSIDGATKASEPPKSGAAHPLFPASSHDKLFALETHLDGGSKASSGAVPMQTSGLFVARASSESTP